MIKLFMFLRKKYMLKACISSYFEDISSPLTASLDKCEINAC